MLVSLVVAMLLYGCLGGPAQNQNQTGTGNSTIGKLNLTADNKTAYENNSQVIANILADGTYEQNVTYAFHSGIETVDISVTVQNDVITAASVTDATASNPYSARMISNLNGALPGLVVGKKINELNIPHNVAGSSLTTAAFAQYVNGLISK